MFTWICFGGLVCLMVLGLGTLSYGTKTKDDDTVWCSVGILISVCLISIMMGVVDFWVQPTVNAYRLGQINAICGKIEYKRVVEADSTIVWKHINEME